MSGVEYIPVKYIKNLFPVCYKKDRESMCIFYVFLPEKSIKSQNKINVIIYLMVYKQSQCKLNKYIISLENGRILTSKIVYFDFLFF